MENTCPEKSVGIFLLGYQSRRKRTILVPDFVQIFKILSRVGMHSPTLYEMRCKNCVLFVQEKHVHALYITDK